MADFGGQQPTQGMPSGAPAGPPSGFFGPVGTPAPVAPSPGTPPPPPGFGAGPGVGPAPAFPPAPVGPPLPPGAVPTPPPPGAYGGPGPYGYGAPLLPAPAPSPTRDLIGRGGGVPPSVGLAIVLAGFPALGLIVYGLLFALLGTLMSSYESDFRNSGFGDSDGLATATGIFGAGILVIGLLFLVSVVFAAAGSRGGRAGTTFFIGGWLLLTFLISLASISDSPGSLIAWLVMATPGLYVLYALWGRPGRGMF